MDVSWIRFLFRCPKGGEERKEKGSREGRGKNTNDIKIRRRMKSRFFSFPSKRGRFTKEKFPRGFSLPTYNGRKGADKRWRRKKGGSERGGRKGEREKEIQMGD
jgi:hypothetical protein